MDKVELLLPGSNLKALKAMAGYADAVYIGTETLNMRMTADNFSRDSLLETVAFAHEAGMKLYLTSNIIIYENELGLLRELFVDAKAAGVDAVIVHDLAAIELARELNIPFHISTQASISNSSAAKFYEKLGAERVILARELSLDMIKEIIPKMSSAKIETFIHGAQCTSISGRCYFSAATCENAHYSANRGRCVQPCRKVWHIRDDSGNEFDYDGVHFLNSKDMCMIEHIPELIEAGITSLKIEGRMRDPHYIEIVARCYREAIDAHYEGTYTAEKAKEWLAQLERVYNRGFSTGFYFNQPNSADISQEKSGNLSPVKKIQIGKVSAYYRKVRAAKIVLYKGPLKLGDEITIEGAKMGNYLTQKLNSIQIKRKAVTEIPEIPEGKSIVIGIIAEKPVKEGDYVYVYR